MLILVDVGNTNILFGIVENNEITNTYRLITDLHGTKEYYKEKINNYLVFKKVDNNSLEGVIISSVVPLLDKIFNEIFEEDYNVKPIMCTPTASQ